MADTFTWRGIEFTKQDGAWRDRYIDEDGYWYVQRDRGEWLAAKEYEGHGYGSTPIAALEAARTYAIERHKTGLTALESMPNA